MASDCGFRGNIGHRTNILEELKKLSSTKLKIFVHFFVFILMYQNKKKDILRILNTVPPLIFFF